MQIKDDQQQPFGTALTGPPPTFVGREDEAHRLQEAIVKRECRVICGPTGIGKTAFVLKVIRDLPAELAGRCLYLGAFKELQDLLRQLIYKLYELKDPTLGQQIRSEGVNSLSFDAWLKALPSSRLKGTLFKNMEKGDYRVFLDHLPPLTRAVAKIIKELHWMRNTPVYLLIHDELAQHLYQFYNFFYWGDRERLTLHPLPFEAAAELLETCIARFGLSQLAVSGFREEVLELSKQIPGAIVKMCSLAADPRYQYEKRIKIKSVYIDYLMSGHNLHFPITKRSGA